MHRRWGVAVLLVLACLGLPTTTSSAADGALPPGSLDPTFGDEGVAGTDVRLPGSAFSRIARDSQDRVVAIGWFGITRLLPDGRRDTQFAPPEAPSTHGPWTDVAVDAEDRIVVAGGAPGFAVSRRLTDGRLDPSFGQVGELVTDLGDEAGAAALAIQPDGHIVVAGTTGHDVVLARYTSTGQLDPSFGAGGIARNPKDSLAGIRDAAIGPGGTIVVVGFAWGASLSGETATRPTVLRFLADGTPDATFGDGGQVVRSVGEPRGSANVVVPRPDGRLLVGVSASSGGLGVLQLLADGGPDPAFGHQGLAATVVNCGPADVNGLAVQADGKVLVAGTSGRQMAVARFTTDGTVDRAFGNAGGVLPLPPVGPIYSYGSGSTGTGLVLQQDGKAVVSGATIVVPFEGPVSVAARLVTAGEGSPKARPDRLGRAYWLASFDGSVTPVGKAGSCGSVQLFPGGVVDRSAVAIAATPTGLGYWLVGADGGVFAFGDAPFLGSQQYSSCCLAAAHGTSPSSSPHRVVGIASN